MFISKIKIDNTEHELEASKLTTPRTISLTGEVTGSVNFDGSTNVNIVATVANKLPVVTATDNDKFLRVVNGTWAAATIPSAEEATFGV